MSEIGWIKLNRQITENWIFPNRRKFTEFEAWIYLLLKASFADSKVYDNGRLIMINRGDLLTSELKLSFEWLWDRGSVRRFLNLLQKDEMIFKKSTSKFTIITICNYASYQDATTTKKQQTNNRRTTHEQQTNTLKEGKEDKEDIKNTKELIYPFVSQSFLDAWTILINQPKWKKKTQHALQASLNKLSKQTESVAIEMINDSIAGGWQGLFTPKKQNNERLGTSAARIEAARNF